MSSTARPRFTYLGHSAVRFDLPNGTVGVVDPWLTGNPTAPADYEFERLDLILVSHAHGDHMADVEPLAKKHDAVVIAAFDLTQWLEGRGVPRTSGMNLGGTQQAFGLDITMVRADHSSGFLDEEGRSVYGGLACGYVVRCSDAFTFYHSGDTALFSDMSLIGDLWRPVLAFLPIGDHFTMDPDQAARACRLLHVQHVVPIHWGTFPVLRGQPADLSRALADQGVTTEVVTMKPGESWTPPE
ncbi:MAG TPA: metal-dependent hydrolase [Thermoanaerobaculia bacterium]|nr:metal-dependent hydrolase [Thermoanaerobaculia bacterium]